MARLIIVEKATIYDLSEAERAEFLEKLNESCGYEKLADNTIRVPDIPSAEKAIHEMWQHQRLLAEWQNDHKEELAELSPLFASQRKE